MKNILMIFSIILFSACSNSDDTNADFTAENEAEIQAYITANNLAPQKSNSGLYYIIDEQGTGARPKLSDRVKVAYKGYFTNGEVFDENPEGLSFAVLANLIPGLAEGINYFNAGGKGKLIIPSNLAYGNRGNEQIPPGAVVIFDIELLYVNYVEENEADIQTYLRVNNLTSQISASGLHYIINEQGTGENPLETSNVTVAYKGYFLDGTVFDESDAGGVSFNLQNVISGWTEGITYFKEGGSGVLLIPSSLAYGRAGILGIPGGAVLVFDINLISLN